MTQVKIDIPLPEGIEREDRRAIADEILEFIRTRTEEGKDKYGRKFQGYSDTYIKSLDFRAAGKSKGKVDLTLTGDMLISLKRLGGDRRDCITIGFKEDEIENDRALGNIKGTYGNDKPITRPRDFMGIKVNELAKIIKPYTDDWSLYQTAAWIREHYDEKQSEALPLK